MPADTIAAIATGTVRSAIGILRLSGPRSLPALEAVFTPRSGRPMDSYPPGRLVLGSLRDSQGQIIDQCIATYSKAPASYTGEDTAELQCHGSPVVLLAGLESLFVHGVRQAGPGEFTKRAFLNGKLDLTQAEAIIDLIDAQTSAACRCAAGQLSGAMSRKITAVYDALVDLSAHFCAVLDYSDEDIEPFERREMADVLRRALRELKTLGESYRRGRRLTQGIDCAIVGRPNSGKSSLLNALLGYQRAIVTDQPGTTRDTVEENLRLGDVLLRLIDTAGLRDTEDEVERQGVLRSKEALQRAELALVVLDSSVPLTGEDTAVRELAKAVPQVVTVVNKTDLPPAWDVTSLDAPHICCVSAKEGMGLDRLEDIVNRLFPAGGQEFSGEVLTNLRQAETVNRAAACLERAQDGLAEGMTPDALLSDVEMAMAALGETTGRQVQEDVTDRIFQRFCVGK